MKTMDSHDHDHPGQSFHNISGTTSEMRRKYPKDIKGAKNEWQAMIHH